MLLFPFSAPTHLFSLLLSLSLLLKHTQVHTTVCCAGKPNDQGEKPQVPKKKSQSLRCLAFTLTSCVRKPFCAPAPPPMSAHRPFRPVSLPLYFQPFVKEKRKGKKTELAATSKEPKRAELHASWRVMSRTNRVQAQ